MLRRNIILSHCKNYGGNCNIRGNLPKTCLAQSPGEQFLVIIRRLRAMWPVHRQRLDVRH